MMKSSPDLRRWSAWCSQAKTNASSTRGGRSPRGVVGVLLDDREEIGEQALLGALRSARATARVPGRDEMILSTGSRYGPAVVRSPAGAAARSGRPAVALALVSHAIPSARHASRPGKPGSARARWAGPAGTATPAVLEPDEPELDQDGEQRPAAAAGSCPEAGRATAVAQRPVGGARPGGARGTRSRTSQDSVAPARPTPDGHLARGRRPEGPVGMRRRVERHDVVERVGERGIALQRGPAESAKPPRRAVTGARGRPSARRPAPARRWRRARRWSPRGLRRGGRGRRRPRRDPARAREPRRRTRRARGGRTGGGGRAGAGRPPHRRRGGGRRRGRRQPSWAPRRGTTRRRESSRIVDRAGARRGRLGPAQHQARFDAPCQWFSSSPRDVSRPSSAGRPAAPRYRTRRREPSHHRTGR